MSAEVNAKCFSPNSVDQTLREFGWLTIDHVQLSAAIQRPLELLDDPGKNAAFPKFFLMRCFEEAIPAFGSASSANVCSTGAGERTHTGMKRNAKLINNSASETNSQVSLSKQLDTLWLQLISLQKWPRTESLSCKTCCSLYIYGMPHDLCHVGLAKFPVIPWLAFQKLLCCLWVEVGCRIG